MEVLAWGPVSPFDAAATVLLIGGAVVLTTWPENYGESNEKVSIAASWRKALDAIFQGAPPGPATYKRTRLVTAGPLLRLIRLWIFHPEGATRQPWFAPHTGMALV